MGGTIGYRITKNGRDGMHTGQIHYRTMENNKE